MSEEPEVKAYTVEQLRERLEYLKKVRESMVGTAVMPVFVNVLDMEMWALGVAADLLTVAKRIVDDNPKAAEWGDDDRHRMAVAACESIATGDFGAGLI